MIVLGLDPGPKESAYAIWDGTRISAHDTLLNEQMLPILSGRRDVYACFAVVIEWIVGYGLTVGRETFDTCRWVGRFEQAAGGAILLTRKQVKQHLCSSLQAKDNHVRQALLDKIGLQGTKKQPGPTHGIVGHEWAALAVAVTWLDTQNRI